MYSDSHNLETPTPYNCPSLLFSFIYLSTPKTLTHSSPCERENEEQTANVVTVIAWKAIGDSSGASTVSCSSVREAEIWRANLAMVASKMVGDGVAGRLTTGKQLFRWPVQQQQQQQ